MARVAYESVVNGVPAVREAHTLDLCNGSTYQCPAGVYNPPPSVTRYYDPVDEQHWRTEASTGNFTARKRAGEIVMSPYKVGRKTTRRFIVQIDRKTKHRSPYWSTYGGQCCDVHIWTGVKSWTDQVTDSDIDESVPLVGELTSGTDADVSRLISLTQQEAFARSFDGVDLTTELAEAGKTYQLGVDLVGGAAKALERVAQRVPRNTPRRWRSMSSRQLLRSTDKLLRKAGSVWLGAIYGILPVTYLVKDAVGLNKGKQSKFHTYRSQRTVTRESSGSSSEATYLLYQASGSITVKSTVKVGYQLGSPQYLADQISTNPFRTLWELIPYSFVVDWFLNAGNAITAATSLDLSTQRMGCTSVKRVVQDSVFLVDNAEDISDLTYLIPGSDKCWPQVNSWEVFVHPHQVDALLYSIDEQSYDRTLFSRPDPKLHFDPFLSWKNIVSGVALAYQPISRTLRRLLD